MGCTDYERHAIEAPMDDSETLCAVPFYRKFAEGKFSVICVCVCLSVCQSVHRGPLYKALPPAEKVRARLNKFEHAYIGGGWGQDPVQRHPPHMLKLIH